MKIDIEIKKRLNNIKQTQHSIQKEYMEGITAKDLEDALKRGFEVIEEYPDDPRGASCLLLCRIKNKPFHVVCAPHEDSLVIITVYAPKLNKWMEDYKTRR